MLRWDEYNDLLSFDGQERARDLERVTESYKLDPEGRRRYLFWRNANSVSNFFYTWNMVTDYFYTYVANR